jgi:hypothetical protein
LFVAALLISPLARAEQARPWATNGVSLDIPLDGGAMVSYQRTWLLTKYIDAGLVVSGGQIRRRFDLDSDTGRSYNAETTALVLPLAGPFVTLHWSWFGISLGYAGFWAKTDLTVKDTPGGTLNGTTKAWGSGFYAPLLVFDFFDEKHDLMYGFGLGGYFGSHYKDMTASSSTYALTTDASPIDTLTFHVRCLWADGRWKRGSEQQTNPF